MKVASDLVAALISACSLLRFSLAISSSRTLTEALFSLVVDMAVLGDSVERAGMLEEKEGGGGGGGKSSRRFFFKCFR